MRLLVVALTLPLVLSFLIVASVFAHAEPAVIKPGDGAVLNESPTQVEIEMSQEMARRADANDIDVFNEQGQEVTVVAAAIDNANRSRLTVALPSSLPPGKYTVRWKTLSAEDADTADGELSFTIDPNATPNPGKENLKDVPTPPPADPPQGEALAPADLGGDGGGTSWVLVSAVAVGCLVLGSGTTFLLVQKKE